MPTLVSVNASFSDEAIARIKKLSENGYSANRSRMATPPQPPCEGRA